MNLEISLEPFRVTLFGCRGVIKDGIVHASAMPLMDRMWKEVRDRGIETMGINHWVYLPNAAIFVGVELKNPDTDAGSLVRLDVSLDRYVTHLHRGPYGTLGVVWPQLMEEIKQRGEKPRHPHLEVYGHWEADETKCETTILIGLEN